MTDEHVTTYPEMQTFLDFTSADADNLKALAPVFAKHGANMTNRF